jgi:hypothetical protein
MSDQEIGDGVLENIRIQNGPEEYPAYLLCPQCGYEFLHITRVSVHRGEDRVTITGENVSMEAKKNNNRGVEIEIEYEGECEHRGRIVFHFYKGNVQVYYYPLEDRPMKDGMFTDSANDIFRD